MNLKISDEQIGSPPDIDTSEIAVFFRAPRWTLARDVPYCYSGSIGEIPGRRQHWTILPLAEACKVELYYRDPIPGRLGLVSCEMAPGNLYVYLKGSLYFGLKKPGSVFCRTKDATWVTV